MGAPDPEKPRLLKVVFSTRHHQRQVISRFTELAREQKASFQFRDVFMRKSLTAEEREADRRLRDELKKRKDNGEKCWIYGGKIVTSRQPTRHMQATDHVTSRRPNATSREPTQHTPPVDVSPGNLA
ncbi:hypothetical protein AAVH_37153 [Aphelenchoides avenae]|nr:hypothetical protein AAVH_37153 [Aphelenchus avenae]